MLIPGFVVGGSGTLRVLVRAIGPGLAGFGVTGTLGDPTLTIFRGGVAMANNDDWSSAANAAEMASAADTAGAFALGPGSRDSALLVTLIPGAYTAVVSGGATGTALVEIFTLP